MTHNLLDDLVFQTGPLGEPIPNWPPDLSLQIPVSPTSQPSSGKIFRQLSPLVARRAPMLPSDVAWPAYCGLLRDFGVMLQTSYASLESLSDVNVPLRLAERALNDGFVLQELESADAMVISCVAREGDLRYARLPLETSAWHELKQIVDCVRPIAGPHTPIGISMLAGDVYTDVSNALAARVDFVVLEANTSDSKQLQPSQIDHLAWSVVAARNACQQSGQPKFPIILDAPLTSIDHLIKLLAIGASGVAIDALIAAALPQTTPSAMPVPKGLLSGIGSLPVKSGGPNIEPLSRKLMEVIAQLRSRVFQLQLSQLANLNRDHVRALTESAARLCGVRLLEHV